MSNRFRLFRAALCVFMANNARDVANASQNCNANADSGVVVCGDVSGSTIVIESQKKNGTPDSLNTIPSRTQLLRASNATGSGTTLSQELKIALSIKNTSGNVIQIFVADRSTAIDNAGHSYTNWPQISGIYVCQSETHCLTDEKERTEQSATILYPQDDIPLVMTFCCKISRSKLGNKASFSANIRFRESSDGRVFGPWRSTSIGMNNVDVVNGEP